MRLVSIRHMDNGWAVVARSWCECSPKDHAVTVRAVYGYTLEAAVKRFKFARREERIVDEATGG